MCVGNRQIFIHIRGLRTETLEVINILQPAAFIALTKEQPSKQALLEMHDLKGGGG